MIIIYNKITGDLVRFITGTCLNANTHETDSYLNVRPGGQYSNPDTDQSVFNLDENADPTLADAVAAAIYNDSERYYIAHINGTLTLLENVP